MSLTPAQTWLEPAITSEILSGEEVLQRRAPETSRRTEELQIFVISACLARERLASC